MPFSQALLRSQEPPTLKGENFCIQDAKGLLDCKDLVLKSTLSIWERIKQKFSSKTAAPKWVKIEVIHTQTGKVQKVYFNARTFVNANAHALDKTNQSTAVNVDTSAVYAKAPHTSGEFVKICKNSDKTAVKDAVIDVLRQSNRIKTEIPKLEQKQREAEAAVKAAITKPEPEPTWTSVGEPMLAIIQTVILPDGTTFTGTGIQIEAAKGRIEIQQAKEENEKMRLAALEEVARKKREARQKFEQESVTEEAILGKQKYLEKQQQALDDSLQKAEQIKAKAVQTTATSDTDDEERVVVRKIVGKTAVASVKPAQSVPVRNNNFITEDPSALKMLKDKKATEIRKDHGGAYWYEERTPEPNESYSLKPGGKNPPSKVRPGNIGKYW
jgi:hypothetical protein